MYNLEFEATSTAAYRSDVLYKKNIHPPPYSVFKIHHEFHFINKDIKYVPGILFFLKPYIVNTEMLGGEYFHNLVHRDYPLYANFGVQSIYNFWDRTGDILFLYFHKDLKHDSGYFSKVMNNFAKEYRQSTPYLKLNALYEQVTELLSLRHEAVHHFQIEAKHYWATLSYMKTTKKEIRRMAT